MSTPQEKKKTRTPIGKFMLWLFYLFCIYAAFYLCKTLYDISQFQLIPGEEVASRVAEGITLVSMIIYLLIVGGGIGLLAWLTRAK